jgi:hypothetical protein
MQGVRRVPTGLAELVKSDPAQVVFVTKAGRMRTGGRSRPGRHHETWWGGKFTAEMGQFLRGRRVVALQDNDEAGQITSLWC